MAFISYNSASGGGSEHEVREGHYGLSVEQYLYDDSSNAFISAVATMVSTTSDNIKNVFRRKAPFDTSYKEMSDLAAEVYSWWVVRSPEFTKIKAALTASYNPIENYRRKKEGYQSKLNGSVADVGAHNTSDGDSETDSQVYPYDTVDAFNKEKSHTTYSENVDISNTKTYTNLQDDVSITDSGNVGVTTNQQMITEEIELRVNNNLLFIIIREFVKEFCIPLYN